MLEDLGKYDIIAVWGAGQYFESWYKKQFHCDCLIDNDINKIGGVVSGIKVISPDSFFDLCKNKNALLIISVLRYQCEIEKQVLNIGFSGDIITTEEFNLVYNHENLSFSQFGIDRFCVDILRKANFNLADMSFIEIGANHPIAGNQTYLFYLLGARGLLVEPNPDLVDVLEKFRPEDEIVTCGLGIEEGKMTFYRLDNSYRSSFDKKTVDVNLKLGFRLKDTIDIPVISFDYLLKEYSINPEITYLSLEVMGLEKTFFDKVDIFKYGFPLIRVADHCDLFDDYCDENGYIKIAAFPRNVVFMKRNIYMTMAL